MRPALILCLAVLAAPAAQASPGQTASAEAKLCRAQLELLVSRNRLTEDEEARFVAQCDCLETLDGGQDTSTCAQEPEEH